MTEHTDLPMSIPDGLQDVRKGSGRNRVTLDNRRGKKTYWGHNGIFFSEKIRKK